ncbi:MAG: TIM barrel protein [Deinococcota bacterium]
MTIRQSFAWWSFAQGSVAPADLIQSTAEIGYDAIEMAPQEHWQTIRDQGLTLLNTQAHPLIPAGLNRLENYDAIKAEVVRTLELATTWGLPYLICFSGDRMGLADDVGLEHTVTNLCKLVPLAEQAGVELHLEMLNSKVDHPDYQADTTAWAVEVCKQVASPNLKLLYDVYHMQVMEGDLIRTIQDHHESIGHYHTAGNPGRQDLDEDQEIAYPAVFRAIRDSGYTGYIGHEFVPKDDPIEALQEAYQLTARYV